MLPSELSFEQNAATVPVQVVPPVQESPAFAEPVPPSSSCAASLLVLPRPEYPCRVLRPSWCPSPSSWWCSACRVTPRVYRCRRGRVELLEEEHAIKISASKLKKGPRTSFERM